ncbi:MAG: regulatory protein RecX [Pseudomonadota bacterium]
MSERTRKPPPPLTEATLEQAGFWYVERYGGNGQAVRRALMRRVQKAAQEQPVDRAEAAIWVEAVLARLVRAGLVDDGAWARSKAKSLLARGKPTGRIRAELRARGIDAEQAAEAVQTLEEQPGDTNLLAALTYARRRRLGPFRPEHQRAERRQKDLGAMARAGFSYALSSEILDSDDIEDLERRAGMA